MNNNTQMSMLMIQTGGDDELDIGARAPLKIDGGFSKEATLSESS